MEVGSSKKDENTVYCNCFALGKKAVNDFAGVSEKAKRVALNVINCAIAPAALVVTVYMIARVLSNISITATLGFIGLAVIGYVVEEKAAVNIVQMNLMLMDLT